MNENEFQPAKKQCSRCWEFKPRSAFNKRAMAKDGLQPHCRECDQAWKAWSPSLRAAERARNAKIRRDKRAERVPAWSVCGPYYPKDANGLLVPLNRLDKAQRAQVRQLNKLRAGAGVFLLPVEED